MYEDNSMGIMVHMTSERVQPFLRWPGGKRWLVNDLADGITLLPGKKYIEPFLGGGALFFAKQPQKAILSDINPEIVNLFVVMRDKPNELRKRMINHQKNHCKDYYYSVRSQKPKSDVNKAARTLYLNRTCFNGLYRVNKSGEFNVPIGSKNNCIYDIDCFNDYSRVLKNAQICSDDFETTIAKAEEGDFIFADPPYAVNSKDVFTKYNDKLFTWDDQIRLFKTLVEARNKGVIIISTNALSEELVDLYKSENFGVCRIERHCSMAGNPNKRKKIEELLVFSECIGNRLW